MRIDKLLISIFVLAFNITADEIRLKNGRAIEGIVKNDDGEEVNIEINIGEMAIPHDEIDSIVYSGLQKNKELKINWKIKERENEKEWRERRRNQPQKKIKKKPHGKIKIFVTDWCGYCIRLERMLEAGNYEYERCDIEKSKDCMKEFKRIGKGGTGVPLTVIGDKAFRGFDAQEFEKLLQ